MQTMSEIQTLNVPIIYKSKTYDDLIMKKNGIIDINEGLHCSERLDYKLFNPNQARNHGIKS